MIFWGRPQEIYQFPQKSRRAGKTRTAIQEELVEMVGMCPMHVGSGTNPSMSRSLRDLLWSSPENLSIYPKIEKGPL